MQGIQVVCLTLQPIVARLLVIARQQGPYYDFIAYGAK